MPMELVRNHPSLMTERVVINFSVRRRVPHGNVLYLVGNIEDFGAWNPENGLKMKWHKGHIWKATWYTKRRQIGSAYGKPQHEVLEADYKYVSRNRDTGQLTWEREENHHLNLDLMDCSSDINVENTYEQGFHMPMISVLKRTHALSSPAHTHRGHLVFVVRGPPARYGPEAHHMVLVGDTPEMGAWDCKKDGALRADGRQFDHLDWSCVISLR